MIDIDTLARRNGAALRDDVERTLDVDASRLSLRRRSRRRHAGLVAVAAAAVVAVVIATIGVAAREWGRGSTEPAPAPPAPTATVGRGSCQANPPAYCRADGRIGLDTPHPYSFRVSSGFDPSGWPGDNGTYAEVVRDDVKEPAGIYFLDGVRAARSGTIHRSAEELARWIGSRPYLVSGAPVATSLGGRPAWSVQATAARSPNGAGEQCNRTPVPECWPVLALVRPGAADREIGPRDRMISRWVLADLPDGTVFAVWSWAASGDPDVLDADQETLRTFRFGR